MSEPSKCNDPHPAPNPQPPQTPPGCHNCVHAVWDWHDCVNSISLGWAYRPLCACQPDAPGQMQKVTGNGPCRNWRPKPRPPVRGQAPDPTPAECQIALTKGLFALVDPADYEWLSRFRWHATCSRGRYYAATVVNGKSISMHRMIMNPPPGMQVDHKNRNGLDNHRINLRLATPEENRFNSRPRRKTGSRPTSSQYLGVSRHRDKWKAKIKHRGKEHLIGLFTDEIEAALARDAKALELHGEFAYLNFPNGPPPGYGKRET